MVNVWHSNLLDLFRKQTKEQFNRLKIHRIISKNRITMNHSFLQFQLCKIIYDFLYYITYWQFIFIY